MQSSHTARVHITLVRRQTIELLDKTMYMIIISTKILPG